MRIQEGGIYRSRCGYIHGPIKLALGKQYRASDSDLRWNALGEAQKPAYSQDDLVEELIVIGSAGLPADVEAESDASDELLEMASERALSVSDNGSIYAFTPDGLHGLHQAILSTIPVPSAEPEAVKYQISAEDQNRIDTLTASLESANSLLQSSGEELESVRFSYREEVAGLQNSIDDLRAINKELGEERDKMFAEKLEALAAVAPVKQPAVDQLWRDGDDELVRIIAVTAPHKGSKPVVVFRDVGRSTTRHLSVEDWPKEMTYAEG